MYIEVNLNLNSYDLISIESLINWRLDELKEVQSKNEGGIAWLQAEEQIENYNVTLAKIKKAREDVKRVKAEADAIYDAGRKARASARS